MPNIQIAVDGPAGSGKSTIAKELARRLHLNYLDTGAMYRALALKALRKGWNLDDADSLARLADNTDLYVRTRDDGTHVYLDEEDVTDVIRTAEVGRAVPKVAAVPAIREYLVSLQRAIAKDVDVVMDGRDIGSTVLPDATYKFFLQADVAVRAQRRLLEMRGKGDPVSLEDMIEDIRRRDEIDSTRAVSPLTKAEDAIEIDTTNLSIDDVLARIESHISVDALPTAQP